MYVESDHEGVPNAVLVDGLPKSLRSDKLIRVGVWGEKGVKRQENVGDGSFRQVTHRDTGDKEPFNIKVDYPSLKKRIREVFVSSLYGDRNESTTERRWVKDSRGPPSLSSIWKTSLLILPQPTPSMRETLSQMSSNSRRY